MSEKVAQQEKPSNELSQSIALSRDELWGQMEHSVVMAAKEDQIVWTIFGVFWAANAVLLVALFSSGEMPNAKAGTVISAAGAILALVWFVVQRRAIRWLSYYENIIYRIEKEYLIIPPDIALSARINNATFMKEIGHGIRVRRIMIGSSVMTALCWVAALAWFLWLLLSA